MNKLPVGIFSVSSADCGATLFSLLSSFDLCLEKTINKNNKVSNLLSARG